MTSSIIGSLAGVSFYGPVAGHGFVTHDLQAIRAERDAMSAEKRGSVKGALGAEETKEGFLKLTKQEPKEDKKKEESEKKAEEAK